VPYRIPKEPPTDVECAYAAGIIDGEGCIYARFRRDVPASHAPVLTVRVAMIDPLVPARLKSWFGGSVILLRKERPCRDQYLWQIASFQAEQVLIAIKPWAITKSKQIAIALELRSMTRSSSHYKPVTESDQNLRIKLVNDLKQAKRA